MNIADHLLPLKHASPKPDFSMQQTMIRRTALFTLLVVACFVTGCATSSPIQRFSESSSAFKEPPVLMSHNYPQKDIYRIYHRAATGYVSIQSIRHAAEQRAQDFAGRQGKSIVIIGERISQPPYILGNFPRIEIVFAVIDPSQRQNPSSSETDKYGEIEKLKKLLDQGALTKEEFEREKAKLLR